MKILQQENNYQIIYNSFMYHFMILFSSIATCSLFVGGGGGGGGGGREGRGVYEGKEEDASSFSVICIGIEDVCGSLRFGSDRKLGSFWMEKIVISIRVLQPS